jgi:uncharacterized membrane protein YeaQ/YmgE (transglycosylase-associated protein family)
MTVAAWLGSGLLVSAIAWMARPGGYPAGPATAVAAGLCGGFLGGAGVILVDGSGDTLRAVSVCGAAVGAIVMLDVAERASGSAQAAPRSTTLARLWTWACLLDPLLLAGIVGISLGAASGSPPIGVLAGAVVVLLFYWQRNSGLVPTRRWRR